MFKTLRKRPKTILGLTLLGFAAGLFHGRYKGHYDYQSTLPKR